RRHTRFSRDWSSDVCSSDLADELFAAASTWLGRVRGGLAMATALAGAGFGAISGSSTAAAATLSATTVPAMLRRGYDPALAGGEIGSASCRERKESATTVEP